MKSANSKEFLDSITDNLTRSPLVLATFFSRMGGSYNEYYVPNLKSFEILRKNEYVWKASSLIKVAIPEILYEGDFNLHTIMNFGLNSCFSVLDEQPFYLNYIDNLLNEEDEFDINSSIVILKQISWSKIEAVAIVPLSDGTILLGAY